MSTIEIPTNDAVEMVRAIRNKHYAETLHMTEEEKTLYERQKAEAGRRLIEEMRLEKIKRGEYPPHIKSIERCETS